MGDEFKTLLKIEGDASGAKKAAEETKAATAQMGQAATSAGQATTQVTEKTTQALDQKTKKTTEAKSGFDKLAQSMGTNERAAMAFREALSRISPEMAGLLNIGIKFQEIMSFGLSKIGLVIGGIIVAITAVAAAFNKVQEAIKKAEDAARQFREENERIRVAAREKYETAVKGAAGAGLPPAAVGGVRAMTDRLVRKGIDPQTAAATAPYFVDDTGKQVVSTQEAAQIAAAQQFGFIDPMKGAGAKRPAGLENARRWIGQQATGPVAANAAVNLEEAEVTKWVAMMQGQDLAHVREWVESTTGKTGPALDRQTEIVMEELGKGRRREIKRQRVGTALIEFEADLPLDPLTTQLRQRGQQIVGGDTPHKSQTSQPVTINSPNYGLQIFGKDSRGVQIPRVTNP